MASGVAERFWLRIEQERIALGWTKDRLSIETKRYTPDKKAIPRSTIDNLRSSTRVPQPRIVNALADAVALDRVEAAQLAGLLPPTVDARVSARQAVILDPTFTDRQRAALLEEIDAYTALNEARRRSYELDRSDDTKRAM